MGDARTLLKGAEKLSKGEYGEWGLAVPKLKDGAYSVKRGVRRSHKQSQKEEHDNEDQMQLALDEELERRAKLERDRQDGLQSAPSGLLPRFDDATGHRPAPNLDGSSVGGRQPPPVQPLLPPPVQPLLPRTVAADDILPSDSASQVATPLRN